MKTLASIASVQPQATYAALTKSLQSEWLFPLESFPIVDLIWKTCFHHVFLPFLCGVELSAVERQLFSLPL